MSNATDAVRAVWDRQAQTWHDQREFVLASSRPVHDWLVDAVDPRPGQRLLDIAAGPGDTGFAAARRLLPDGVVLSTDLSPAMVEVARARAAELGVTNVELRVLDAQRMELADRSVDAAVCRWGLMLMPDRAAAVRETRRVLRSAGRFASAVFAGPKENPWAAIAIEALMTRGKMQAPAPGAPGLFALADRDRLAALYTDAGFGDVRVEAIDMAWKFPTDDAHWHFLVELTLLGPILRALSDDEARELRSALSKANERFRKAGALDMPARCLGVVGTAP